MTFEVCQKASTERCPQPSRWYHSVRSGMVGDQRRVVDWHDGRIEHVPGRARVPDLQEQPAAEAAGPRDAVDGSRARVEQVGLAARRVGHP